MRVALAASLLLVAGAHAQEQAVGVSALEQIYGSVAIRLASLAAAYPRFTPPLETLPPAVRLCERIHADAVELTVAFGGAESWAYNYASSECFNDVAIAAKAPELCDRVRIGPGTPPRVLPASRERKLTREACRGAASKGTGRVGHEEYGNALLLLLLGYTPEQIAEYAGGPLEEDGADDAMSAIFFVPSDDDGAKARLDDFLVRLARLPDFARGDGAARRQLDAIIPGWSDTSNESRLAATLRCAVERPTPGGRLSERCRELIAWRPALEELRRLRP